MGNARRVGFACPTGRDLWNRISAAKPVHRLAWLARSRVHRIARPGWVAGSFAVALAILATGALGAVGTLTALSQYEFGKVQVLHKDDPLTALNANLETIRILNWPMRPRIQLSLTLHNLLAKYTQAQITPQAVDRVYQIARSASPYATSTLMVRAEFLIATGLDQPELVSILQWMMEHQRLQPETWLLVAAFAYSQGDYPAAYAAASTGLKCRGIDPPVGEYLTRIQTLIEATP